MKKILFATIITVCALPSAARQADSIAVKDISIGYNITEKANQSALSSKRIESPEFDYSPEVELGKALFGKIAGLNVSQGNGIPCNNHASLSMHGYTPLVLIDGFQRDISMLNIHEVESVSVLNDAVAAALYGVEGANGVVLITTKRGAESKLRVNTNYQIGIATQFRNPQFLNSFEYGTMLNQALANDGLAARYSDRELEAFRTGNYPYVYPNVDWWGEVFDNTAVNHQFNVAISGGTSKFKYYTAAMYSYDESLLNGKDVDSRYSIAPTDIRLNVRSNIDAVITPTTNFKMNMLARLQEANGVADATTVFDALYKTPSAAFPVQAEDGTWGGNSMFANPVALLKGKGVTRKTFGTFFADLTLTQELDAVTKGLSAELAVAFDYNGVMTDASSQEYRYVDPNGSFLGDGTLVSNPIYYGKNSETLSYSQGRESIYTAITFNAKLAYERNFGLHHVTGNLLYNQRSYSAQGRNNSVNRMSASLLAGYSYDNRYLVDAVVSYSGSGYLPKGEHFNTYPAVSLSWIASNESFLKDNPVVDLLKVRASYGLSGWDGNLSHELALSGFVYDGSYYFGNNAGAASGLFESALPVVGLTAERSKRVTMGIDFAAFGNRLGASIDAYHEERSDILLNTNSLNSDVVGITTGSKNLGVNRYKGIDASLSWNDRIRKFEYGIKLNYSYMQSEVVKDERGYQEYDYLYRTGKAVGQFYGLEAIGFFDSQLDINNSPRQTFSDVKPGDVKYKDQNGDNVIDSKDIVSMFGTSLAPVYYGASIRLAYEGFEINADFQGAAGTTVNIMNSPIYQPLVDNATMTRTYLDREIPWTYENRNIATMPVLSTQKSLNNTQGSSLWYRDTSYFKLRNLRLAYTLPKKWVKNTSMTVYVQGTNLFSADNIEFADPEAIGVVYPSTRCYWGGLSVKF
ncbi:SusC/RagA family TonB-linked outer membrane protein [uncultured Bacteroides sp.]|uniref:SusC/RagA family TonB-linked outer membrane protein n=1 Tax=uncultured Bacteroides sp. TaxID=162156 RepID=UPI0026756929|nr:SusC/RagA family TonB-linked outer membrane protein [uncultured Bacteroides sp.]